MASGATMDEEKKRILPEVTLEESYKICDRWVADRLKPYAWMGGNIASGSRRYFHAVLALAARTEKMCDIHVGRAARLDQLADFREDFRNNFMEEESTDQFPALLDTVKRFGIPQQYLHDIVLAADMCGRIERFQNFDQWLQLGCRLGGGTLLSLIPIVGAEKQGYEATALSCGQAIYLTHLLADISDEIQKLEYFLPAEIVDEFNVDLTKHNPAKPAKEILRLIRYLVGHIEKQFQAGGSIVKYLNLDGQRVMKTVISVYWNLLMKIKVEPEKVILGEGNLTRKEQFWFKLKHLMGLEGGVVVLPDPSEHHH